MAGYSDKTLEQLRAESSQLAVPKKTYDSALVDPRARMAAQARKKPVVRKKNARMKRIEKLNANQAIIDRLIRKGAITPEGIPAAGFDMGALRPNERRVYNYRRMMQRAADKKQSYAADAKLATDIALERAPGMPR